MRHDSLLRRKTIDAVLRSLEPAPGRVRLRRDLGWVGLMFAGVGIIVGGGIFVVTGTAAAQFAGPAIILSFVVAGVSCGLAALCYAELSSAIPAAGGAYTFAYVALGEPAAWLVGWLLTMEYVCAAAYIAVGWSGYLEGLLGGLGISLPRMLSQPFILAENGQLTMAGGVNLPAVAVVLATVLVVRRGIALSSRINIVLVTLKLAVLLAFVVAAAPHVNAANYDPFIPPNGGRFGEFGWSGVLRGAVVVFVAFLGFDALSTLAQETKRPERNVPLGIVAALAICTAIYIAVATILVGVAPYRELDVSNPLAAASRHAGRALLWLTPLIEVVAVSALASVLILIITALARIFSAMAADGLLPRALARVDERFRSPATAVAAVGAVIACVCGTLPVALLAQLVSVGTLFVFITVCFSLLIIRRRAEGPTTHLKLPLGPTVPLLGIAIFIYMLFGVPGPAWRLFLIWSALGVAIYLAFGRASATRALHEASTGTLGRG